MTPNPSRPMRILAIDGGGMKGVFACAYLQTLEDHFGKHLHEHFDLIAGTSTGGIIALGLGAQKSAAQLLAFYRDHGAAIFPPGKPQPRLKLLRKARAILELKIRLDTGYWYHADPLKRALEAVLKDSSGEHLRMGQAATRLLIPAVNAQNSFPRVFKAHRGEPQVAHLDRDLNHSMVEVAMATAAAPWYLPIAKVDEGGVPFTYIDGGLWANNPGVVAVTEALTYYVGPDREFDSIELLSIGLPSSTGYPNDGRYLRGRQFIDQLLGYAMESSKHGADQTARFLLQRAGHLYYRVRPANLTEDQSKRLRLDGAGAEEIGELMMLGRHEAENDKNKPEIKQIFT